MTSINNYDKSGVLGGNYDSAAMDFEAAHQALLKEARKLGYAEGFEAGRKVEREAFDTALSNGENPFNVDSKAMTDTIIKSAIKETRAFNQQALRDEIVERAKADLGRLKTEWKVRDEMRYIHGIKVCTEEFIVNKEKRTVVCLLRWGYDNSIVSRGIAKCAPGDCFNVHIGKAIALRRALGLPVPDEYLNAPQPTEVRVGDVIGFPFDPFDDDLETVIKVEDGRAYVGEDEFYATINLFEVDELDPDCDPYIIDDSRETEVGE